METLATATNPFACDVETFKTTVTKFLKHCDDPKVTREALDQAWKLVCLRYLNLNCDELEMTVAVSYITYASKRNLERE